MINRPLRVALYSHDSQGLGHVRRNLTIAHHLANRLPRLTGRAVTGLIISGLTPMADFRLPVGFDWVTIPGVAKGRKGYRPRNLLEKTSDLIHLRSGLLDAALVGFAPDLLVLDRHVYGVWQELRAPLQRLRAEHPATKIVLGLREILDETDAVAAEWRALGDPGQLARIVDEVWVYGDPAVYDLLAMGHIPVNLVGRTRHTGYLANGRQEAETPGPQVQKPYLLTTVGGGSDGQDILEAAMGVVPPPGYRHVIVSGPQIAGETFDRLRTRLGPNTELYHSLPGMSTQIANAAAVIAMGGYNTCCEILADDTPALIIPRQHPRREQLIRAQALARIGAVDVLTADELTPEALNRWVLQVLGKRVGRRNVARDGLDHIPDLAADLLQRPRRRVEVSV